MSHGDADDLLTFEGVSLRFEDDDGGGTTVLDDVSVTLPADRTTVIVGPSGAGKSTLLRLCNRLEVPTSGTVRFRGTPLDEIDPDADPDRLHDVLEAVGLSGDLHDREADALSGGEAQRMCIARTLLTDPEVLLLDEPTSALDEDSRDEVEAMADQPRDRGVTLVWITHDQAQAARRGDHVIALRDGRLAFSGHVGEAREAGVLRPETTS